MIEKTQYHIATGKLQYTIQGPDDLVVFPEVDGFSWIDGAHDPLLFKVVNGELTAIPDDEREVATIEAAWVELRRERDRRLAASDWTQVPDAPVNQTAWAAYRQALRDLPANTVDPRQPVWPEPPQ